MRAQPKSGKTRGWSRGFTLTELLIALAIVAILTTVALPLYTNYQLRTHRTQAMADLSACAQALERFYTVNFTYVGAAAAFPGAPTVAGCSAVSPQNGTARYNISVQAADATTFTLRAAPVAGSPQAGNGALELLATDERRWYRNSDDPDETATVQNNWAE